MAFNSANPLTDFRNGLGYIYITKADGTTIVSNIDNTPVGADEAQRLLLTSCPLAGEIASVGTVTITNTINGSVDSLTVNGVDIINATPATGADDDALAIDLRDKINNTTSTPNYIAKSLANVVYIFTVKGVGTSANGFAVVATSTNADTETTNMAGGNDGKGVYDPTFGLRAFLNADYDADGCSGEGTATEGVLTNSVEISRYLIQRGLQNSHFNAESFIQDGTSIVYRVANIQNVAIETEGFSASDDLTTIVPYDGDMFQDGDIIIILGNNDARIVTVKSYVSGQDNIYLANGIDWSSGDKSNVLALRFWNTSLGGFWYELFRSPTIPLSVDSLRAVDIAEPIQGAELTTLPTNGTIDLEAGVDKGYQIYDGTVTLIGSIVIQPQAAPTTPYLDGDTMIVDFRALATIGGNTITIFGITLTEDQALLGKIKVTSTYKLSNTTWYSTLSYNEDGVDFATTTDLASYEPILPTPASNGMVLAGNTDDTKYWIPNTNQFQWYIATYDFDINAGAQGTIDLGTTIPAEAVILADLCFIKTTTIFTSAGAATIELGLTGGTDDIDKVRAYTVSPYDSTSGIDYTSPPVNILRLSTSSKNVTLTIGAADLTAGVAKIYIATVLN